jgi:hypothetical protein
MPKQMWFGNEQRFQWVPAPASGMSVGNVGYAEAIDYQNGRKGIYRSMQTHKEYSLEFPVQEASGATGLDVFNRYASGLYGNGNDYPIFFADLMHYDQNLFAAGWAAPGLYAQGWSTIVQDTPVLLRNFAINPSVETNATGYVAVAGTSGTASGARTSSGPQVSGTWSYRVTWTVATSAVSGGADYDGTPVSPGISYDYMTYVTTSKTQRVQVTVRYRNSSGADVGTATSSQTVLSASTPVKFTVTNSVAPATAATVDIEARAVSGTSGANWANTDWLSLDATVISFSSASPATYFDGSTPGADWAGTAHASASFLYVPRGIPTIAATSNAYSLPSLQATFNVTSTPNAYPTYNNALGEIPYALIPIPPGYTLHMGASGSATGTAQVRVDLFTAPGNPASPAASTTLTLLSSTGSTRLNASWSGSSYQYAKVYIRRTDTSASTITLSAMMAQLWPTGTSPTLTGNFIAGQGHRGLKFADSASVESYVIVDPYRNVPIHYKGLSTSLIEAQDKG